MVLLVPPVLVAPELCSRSVLLLRSCGVPFPPACQADLPLEPFSVASCTFVKPLCFRSFLPRLNLLLRNVEQLLPDLLVFQSKEARSLEFGAFDLMFVLLFYLHLHQCSPVGCLFIILDLQTERTGIYDEAASLCQLPVSLI